MPTEPPVPTEPSVIVVDDHQLIAETLQAALNQRGIAAVAVAPAESSELLATLLAQAPRLVLLDLDLGDHGDSTPIIADLTAAGVKVLVVTGVEDRARVAAALEQGAIGYQSKAAGFEALLAATVAAFETSTVLDPAGRSDLLRELARTRAARAKALEPFNRLTDREADVLRALGEGLSARQIAEDWVVAETTVRTHVRGVLHKLGAPSQLAAVVAAFDAGWLAGRTDA